jgi:hypothetical protein
MRQCGVCGVHDPIMFVGECSHDLLCLACYTWGNAYFVKLVTCYADRPRITWS